MSKVRKNSNHKRIVNLTITAVLTGIIVVMSFTPIGYLKVGPLELTLIMIPVIIGAVTQGALTGAFLGAVFGITSFIQCFTGSVLGAVLVSKSIPKTFIVCFVSRLLAGFLCGFIFSLCKKHIKKQNLSFIIAGISGSLFNTLFFLGLLALLFMNTTFTPEQAAALGGLDSVLNTVIAIAAGINAPVELIACAILGTAIGKAVSTATKKLT